MMIIYIYDSFQINNKEKMECIIEEAKSKMDFVLLIEILNLLLVNGREEIDYID